MDIIFDLNFDDEPIIILNGYRDDSVEGKMFRKFIENAKKRGIVIKDNCVDKDCEYHAEISIKK